MSTTVEIDDMLSVAQLCAMFGVCRETIFRWEQRGDFPRRRKIGKAVRWLAREIAEWQAGLERADLPPYPGNRSKKLLAARAHAPRAPRVQRPVPKVLVIPYGVR